MENFEHRRDRFELFENMESPFVNITFKLEVPNFRAYCQEQNLPPFHFFLYHVFKSLMLVDNFRYRNYQGEVIKVDRLIPSYTVMNLNNVLNFTRFEYTQDLNLFIKRSLEAKKESEQSEKLLHSATEFTEREIKDYVFITSIPWLDFTSIQHPVHRFKSADIPSLAWGKFTIHDHKTITMPFSIQAHHGFVDGHHMNLLALTLAKEIAKTMN